MTTLIVDEKITGSKRFINPIGNEEESVLIFNHAIEKDVDLEISNYNQIIFKGPVDEDTFLIINGVNIKVEFAHKIADHMLQRLKMMSNIYSLTMAGIECKASVTQTQPGFDYSFMSNLSIPGNKCIKIGNSKNQGADPEVLTSTTEASANIQTTANEETPNDAAQPRLNMTISLFQNVTNKGNFSAGGINFNFGK